MLRARIFSLLAFVLIAASSFPAVAQSTPESGSATPEVLLAGGNIRCSSGHGVEATAKLLDANSGTVQTLGDNALPNGGTSDFSGCYSTRWGRHKARTMPAIGHAEYGTPDAAGYNGYFGAGATHPETDFNYSYELGAWRVIVLNSRCIARAELGDDDAFPRCMQASVEWLQKELLAGSTTDCTLAVIHDPRFTSSGSAANSIEMQGMWAALSRGGVDVVLSADEKNYERFAPMDEFGNIDAGGMRQFVVGTAGAPNLNAITAPLPGSEAQNDDDYGILKLELGEGSYGWSFLPVAGKTYSDTGSAVCRADTTAPSTTAALSGPHSSTDFYLDPVEVELTATDDLSGVVSTTYRLDGASSWTPYDEPFLVSDEGAHILDFRSTDRRGNVESIRTEKFTIDRTAPTLSMSSRVSTLWPPTQKLRDIGLVVNADPTTVNVTVEVTSSEGPGQIAPDYIGPASWTSESRLLLRAERNDDGPGRVYTVTAIATDEAGNQSVRHVRVVVPHDQSGGVPVPVPAAPRVERIVTAPGPDPTASPQVKAFDEAGNQIGETIDAFGSSLTHGGEVAACDLTPPSGDEIVVAPGPGPGNGSDVKVFSLDGEIALKLPGVFDGTDGVRIACGDVDGDGRNEIVAGSATGGQIKVLESDGRVRSAFPAYSEANAVRSALVAVADTKDDGAAEIVVAPGPDGPEGLPVKVFDVDGVLRSSFEAVDAHSRGVHIAGGNVAGDARQEIIVSPGPEPLAPGIVRTYRADGLLLSEFGAQGVRPHLVHYGYHHIQDPRYGFYLGDVTDYTNLAHLGQPDIADSVGARGLGPMLELRLGDDPSTWQDRIDYLTGPAFAGDLDAVQAVLVRDQVDLAGWSTETQHDAVALADEVFGDEVETLLIYGGSVNVNGNPVVPPDNVDWVGVDKFFPPGFDNSGCTAEAEFGAIKDHLGWAVSFGKPVLMFAPSFETADTAMPSICQQKWFMEAALSEPSVVGLVWFMYGHAQGVNEIEGAVEHPDVLALHRELFDNVRYGGWGAELTTADLDGNGIDEIVVGNGEGVGNETGVRAFAPDGTPIADAFSAFAGGRFGVSLAAGAFEE